MAYQGDPFAHVMTLNDVPPAEISKGFNEYKRFMFTRNPYQRLFSAYIDKLYFPNGNYWLTLGDYIKRSYRHNDITKAVCGHDVTFLELVKFVVDNQRTLYYRDDHFIPVYEHCRPCQMNYSFIGKFETFANDVEIILEEAGASDLNQQMIHSKQSVLHDIFVQEVYFLFYFKKETVACLRFYKSVQRLWEVMQIRGFIDDMVAFPFAEEDIESLTQEKLLSALYKAADKSAHSKSPLKNRRALQEAYATVPNEYMKQLRDIFQVDCDLFDYDCNAY